MDRGVVVGRPGKTSGAIEDFTAAIRLQPRRPKAYYDRGLTCLRDNDNAAARRDFSAAAKLDPAYADARFDLGVAMESMGDAEGALMHYKNACVDDDPRACRRSGHPAPAH
ncbi:MAG: tetratricopeptide repeat protein [Gammaproteobacteria bacterium]|nr:tetratricopeptide repeat protein [Gammaproteobacteria bacterium]